MGLRRLTARNASANNCEWLPRASSDACVWSTCESSKDSGFLGCSRTPILVASELCETSELTRFVCASVRSTLEPPPPGAVPCARGVSPTRSSRLSPRNSGQRGNQRAASGSREPRHDALHALPRRACPHGRNWITLAPGWRRSFNMRGAEVTPLRQPRAAVIGFRLIEALRPEGIENISEYQRFSYFCPCAPSARIDSV